MKDQNVKPMYVGVDEVCADWGCSRSKGYAIIKQLSEQTAPIMVVLLFLICSKEQNHYYV